MQLISIQMTNNALTGTLPGSWSTLVQVIIAQVCFGFNNIATVL